ncbi:MAG: zinc-ribbon domain-containing protein [Bacteroidetes bacterium]|nr:zinc-ribbon domain-containing protein [Bacteroidota bacterium]
MAFIIYGIKKAPVGITEEMERCPHCETDNFSDIYVTSNYYHIYFIPIFPFEKEVTVVCQRCGLRRVNMPFDRNLLRSYDALNNRFRHSWYLYAFPLFVAFLILIGIIFG